MIAENQNQIKILNSFKNDIMVIIREIESKLREQINLNKIEISTQINVLSDKIKVFQEDNSSIKNIFAQQKFNQEKINEYEIFQKKANSTIITHDIRLNRALEQLEKTNSKFGKLISDNLTVSGFIGPSCKFKSIGDYISNDIKEWSKTKSEKEQMKLEINSIKQKMENMHKNIISLIDVSANRCNIFTNNKQELLTKSVNEKLDEINNKILDMKMRDIQTKLEVEKHTNEFKDHYEKIKDIKMIFDKQIEEVKNFTDNKKVKFKDRQSSKNLDDNLNSSEINKKFNFSRLDLRKERKYSVRIKSLKKFEIKEKEEIKEKDEEHFEENKKDENKTDKEKEINEDIKNINNKFKNYGVELKNIKENIININSKIKQINSFINSLNISKLNNKIDQIERILNTEPNILKVKESKKSQTNLEYNNSETIENKNKFINDESDENIRSTINEKIYQNILIHKRKKEIHLDENVYPKFYDVNKYWNYERNKAIFHNKRFYSPQNKLNRNIYKIKFKKNNEEKINQSLDIKKNIKDLLLLSYNQNNLLKDKNSELKCENLEQSIFGSIKNLINQNKNMKKKENNLESNSLSQKETKISYLSLKNKKLKQNILKDDIARKTNHQNISPIVDKLYKDFYIKKRIKDEKKLNYTNIIQKKAIPAFGRTTYVPIEEKGKKYIFT